MVEQDGALMPWRNRWKLGSYLFAPGVGELYSLLRSQLLDLLVTSSDSLQPNSDGLHPAPPSFLSLGVQHRLWSCEGRSPYPC